MGNDGDIFGCESNVVNCRLSDNCGVLIEKQNSILLKIFKRQEKIDERQEKMDKRQEKMDKNLTDLKGGVNVVIKELGLLNQNMLIIINGLGLKNNDESNL